MLFAEKIRQLREEKQLLQRQISATLEIDNALYCKIERGDRFAKREHVIKLAELFHTDSKELLSFWFADQVTVLLKDEREIADRVLDVVKRNIKK
ncbi:helix-turn-helix domain-containing protein [Bacteroidales bacterium OttesenSCG-928-I14]|nr:helix-turn-helix domain-containing protein [Bacteroidales bacterium OttesenSCG-928-I14]